MRIFLRLGALLGVTAMLAACSLAPKYERPDQQLPASWKNVQLGNEPLHTDWWKRFNDPVLNQLVAEALKKNQDLAESMAKIESAAARRDFRGHLAFRERRRPGYGSGRFGKRRQYRAL